MNKLKIKRREDIQEEKSKKENTVRLTPDSYEKVLDVANESGKSLRQVASLMIDYAFENIVYIVDEE